MYEPNADKVFPPRVIPSTVMSSPFSVICNCESTRVVNWKTFLKIFLLTDFLLLKVSSYRQYCHTVSVCTFCESLSGH